MRERTKTPFRTLTEVPDLRGKRVLVRASLNVPLKDGEVRDSFRIERAVETIAYLKERGARVIVCAHIGREPEETLRPVHQRLEELIPIGWTGALTGERAHATVAALEDGDAVLLENVRSDAREVTNDETFARELAALADMYVNDAFAVSHREHASVVGVPKYLPAYAGFLFTREYTELSRAFVPARPALFILGGAKFETKLPLVERFLDEYDRIFIGGALANDFFKGKGYEVGRSKISDINLSNSSLLTDERIIIPTDVIVDGPNGKQIKAATEVLPEESIFDVGPKTIEALAAHITDAAFVLWNGPLGNYEAGYCTATDELAKYIAADDGESIIGGGDTIASIESLGLDEKFSFVSTAGGAMLTFLETETLPGIEILI